MEKGLTIDLAAARRQAAAASAAASQTLAAREAVVAEVKGKLDVMRRQAAEFAIEKEKCRRQQASHADRQKAVISAWLAAGLTGEPDENALATERDSLAQKTTRLQHIDAKARQLVDGYRRWIHDGELAERQRRLRQRLNAAGLSTEPEMDFHLRTTITEAERRIARSSRTKDQISEVVARLQKDADQYADQVLKPLNSTIHSFRRVLIPQEDGGIVYKAEHHANRSELRPRILRTDDSGGETIVDMNPNLFFSEGQLSALSVSALLAASTTFRWSRWRALLMDDPLQHNDVIHASAFIDVLRQLVVHLGYQVLLSTHDATEAAFVARKCESAGIPFRHYELRPQGDEGMLSVAHGE